MHRRFWALMLVIILVLGGVLLYSYMEFVKSANQHSPTNTLTIAAWNLQIFGDKKESIQGLVDQYADSIKYYDIVFVQEIRDADGSSFEALCNASRTQYVKKCTISSRAGRSSSKEQYGLIYLSKYTLLNFTDYNPDSFDRWERPPIRADFEYKNYSFSIYLIHTKPDDATGEIESLDALILSENSSSNMIVMGDLNADCNYYRNSGKDFSGWNWVIPDDADTTATNSDCAYDRIIMNKNASDELVGYYIDRRTNSTLSDHHPVAVSIRNTESYPPTFARFIMSIFN